MARAHDDVAFDRAPGGYAAVVSADVLDGVIRAVEIEHRDVGAVRVDRAEAVQQLCVRERRVDLLVAGLAEGGAVLGFAAFLFGGEVMEGDQVRRDLAAAPTS